MKEPTLKNLFTRIDHLDREALIPLVKKFYHQKEFFEKIINLIKDGVVMIDRSGRILMANNAVKDMLNLHGARGMVLWKCVPEIIPQISIDQIMQKVVIGEVKLTYPSKKMIRFYSVPFVEGDVARAVCVFSDITKNFMEQERAIESERTDSILLLSAGVAHEIGNPLNSINLQLELMQSFISNVNIGEIAHSIEICKLEVERLHGIIKNFLQAVRPVKPNLADANLWEILNFVIKFLSPELKNADVDIAFEVEGEIPVVLADIDQMKQVFFNVIKNAMESMESEKRLLIRIFTNEDDVVVEFIDTGKGITTEQVGRIFEPFSTTKKNGTGLGMFIVQRILRDHGAVIFVKSQENTGTTISIRFPKKIRSPRMLDAE